MDKIKIKKKYIYIFVAVAIVLSTLAIHPALKVSSNDISPEVLEAKYSQIVSSPRTGGCGALGKLSDGEQMQGACCGKMRLERYTKQRTYLDRYAKIDEIPKDPWDVPVSLAKELTNYDKTVQLTLEEQAVYDEAFDIFDEGPCCCKCWRWTTFDGLAKKLIKERGFSAQQIAELWAAEDVCGDEDPFEDLGEEH